MSLDLIYIKHLVNGDQQKVTVAVIETYVFDRTSMLSPQGYQVIKDPSHVFIVEFFLHVKKNIKYKVRPITGLEGPDRCHTWAGMNSRGKSHPDLDFLSRSLSLSSYFIHISVS
jgi:hypothetical protein